MHVLKAKQRKLSAAISAATVALCFGSIAQAQEQENTDTQAEESSTPSLQLDIASPVEEVMVFGRLQSSATSIIDERVNQAFAADILGAEQMIRVGDPDIASALRRVTGLTLVGGKYIYIRGLGERYSSTLLNGAMVPSPELTRNVIPLDLLPTSIVETVKVQKAYSPDMPSHFGGGNINIRTKNTPEAFNFSIGLDTGTNSESSDDGLTFPGSDAGMPASIRTAIDTYQGNTGVQNIIRIRNNDGVRTEEEILEANQINRDLMLALNRDVGITDTSLDPDLGVKATIGNAWDIGDNWQVGAQLAYTHSNNWRNKNQTVRGVGNPDTIFSDVRRTVEETKEVGGINFGVSYDVDHKVRALYYNISNEENQAQISEGFDASNKLEDGSQSIEYRTRHEARELEVAQVLGEHSIFIGDIVSQLKTVDFDWFYSDSTATTDIPNQTTFVGTNNVDTQTAEVLSTQIASQSTNNFEFLELEDEVESYGWNVKLPLQFSSVYAELSGGYSHSRKARQYYGYTGKIGIGNVASDVLAGTPSDVFTDATLANLDNDFEFTLGTGLGAESYIAAQMIDAAYTMADVTVDDTWRVSVGARWEEFKQAVAPLDLLDYSGQSLEQLGEALLEPNQRIAIQDDDIYPAAAITYIDEGLMGTENFQVRFGYGKTVVRPELREVSDVPYIDPELNNRVQGNPLLVNSDIDHIDLRTEWFYPTSNYTVSLFYKDVANPIETTRTAGSDDNIQLEFDNAVSGEVSGIELEGYSDIAAGFFLSGNLTLSDSEITMPEGQDFTNLTRSMTGHSDVVFNANLGFDSADEKHSASLVLNYFSERVYYAAKKDRHDDAFEQPFTSLDLIYSFYPIESLSFKLTMKNLLDETRRFEQVNSNGITAEILEQDVGVSYKLGVKYDF